MPAAAPEAALRARRKLTNRLIAGHDAARLRPFFSEDAVLIVGDGGVILGADNILAAFAAQFADTAFETYVRTTETVEIAEGGDRAAESGRWVGRWKGGAEMSGTYLAAWRVVRGQWQIEREFYVTIRG